MHHRCRHVPVGPRLDKGDSVRVRRADDEFLAGKTFAWLKRQGKLHVHAEGVARRVRNAKALSRTPP